MRLNNKKQQISNKTLIKAHCFKDMGSRSYGINSNKVLRATILHSKKQGFLHDELGLGLAELRVLGVHCRL